MVSAKPSPLPAPLHKYYSNPNNNNNYKPHERPTYPELVNLSTAFLRRTIT